MNQADWKALKASAMNYGTDGGLLQELLGCAWGRKVATPDDEALCEQPAERVVVVHDGDAEVALKLCAQHIERLNQETTPRMDDGG